MDTLLNKFNLNKFFINFIILGIRMLDRDCEIIIKKI